MKRKEGEAPSALAPEAPANKKTKPPRRDKGTARLVIPKGLARQLEADAKLAGLSVPEMLVDWRELATRPVEEVPQLPKAVLAVLAPAAEATGRSMTDLLGEYERSLLKLLRGELYDAPEDPQGEFGLIPALADLLVERFRAKLGGK